jgi:hypothetical protein
MKRMKRVLLLACLIVSLVELDWERYRIFLLSSIASFLFVLGSELARRPRVQQVATERAFKTGEGFPSEAYVSDSLHPVCRPDNVENEPARTTVQEIALRHTGAIKDAVTVEVEL